MKKLRILLVDDDKLERFKFKKVCQNSNFQVELTELEDGEQAINLLQSNQNFDLVVSDLYMPKLDGASLIAQIKLHLSTKIIPAVIMSSSRDKNDFNRCLSNGAAGYFDKPAYYPDYVNNILSLLDYWSKSESYT